MAFTGELAVITGGGSGMGQSQCALMACRFIPGHS